VGEWDERSVVCWSFSETTFPRFYRLVLLLCILYWNTTKSRIKESLTEGRALALEHTKCVLRHNIAEDNRKLPGSGRSKDDGIKRRASGDSTVRDVTGVHAQRRTTPRCQHRITSLHSRNSINSKH